jgi:myosin-15
MRQFLVIVSKFPLCGSRFFYLESVSDRRIDGPCLMAINKSGISFLRPNTRDTMLAYPFSEVVSTRQLGVAAGLNLRARPDPGKRPEEAAGPTMLTERSGPARPAAHYIDLRFGNLMVQRVTRCETRQGAEITHVITAYLAAFVEKEHQKQAASLE